MIVKFRSMKNKQFYFRVVANNNKTIAASEGYKTRRGRNNGVISLFKTLDVGDCLIVDLEHVKAAPVYRKNVR